jgi:hypothetical protein
MNKLLERAIQEAAALPEEQQEEVAACLLEEVHRRVPPKSNWAEIADRLAKLDAFKGRSTEFRQHVREFRDNFSFRDAPHA